MKEEWRIKNRFFNCVLYPEDKNYNIYFKKILENYKQVTWITHNRDIEEIDGEEKTKKEHTHIIFNVGENARHIKAIAKEIGIEPNYLQGTKKTNFLRYLIHLDNPEKTQYDISEVYGELKEELKKEIMKNKDETKIIAEITTKILNREIRSNTELILYAINNNCLNTVKKYHYMLNKTIEERNLKAYECKKLHKN